MRLVIVFVVSVLLLGCARRSSNIDTHEVKLKTFLGKSDLLLTKKFFGIQAFSLPKHPDEVDGLVVSRWKAAAVGIEPIVIEETEKSGTEIKGARIDLSQASWKIFADGIQKDEGGAGNGSAFLDGDEVHDLDSAVLYMQKTAQTWKATPPRVHTEIMFSSRDGFKASLVGAGNDSPAAVLEAGGASVVVDEEHLTDLKTNLDKVVKVLEAN